MRDAAKGHQSLRRGRFSTAGSLYFVTICTRQGTTGLNHPKVFDHALSSFTGTNTEPHALVLMPDHLYLLFELKEPSSLEEVIRIFKGRLSPVIRSLGLRWQKGSYFDRKLRKTDSVEAVLRYMQMNPYRKYLMGTDKVWPFWYCTDLAQKWIGTDEDAPLPEWL